MRRHREENHRDTFLPGYSDYAGDLDGTDDGYVVMSYVPPIEVPTEQVIDRIRAHIVAKYPCYSATEQTGITLVLRCPGGRTRYGSSRWDEEYRFLLNPRQRRVFMLVLDSVKRAGYGDYSRSLDAFREPS